MAPDLRKQVRGLVISGARDNLGITEAASEGVAVAQLVDRSTGAEARWQVRWKARRAAAGRSQTFFAPLVSRGKSSAQRDAERLKA